MARDLQESFDVACANLGASLDHLQRIVEILKREGGYRTAAEQLVIAEARAFLAERGRK